SFPDGEEMDSSQPGGEVTQLLKRLEEGDREAVDRLYPLVYGELRGAARRAMAGERAGHSLQATELVHEAYFKLLGAHDIDWQGRGHFVAIAARAMRQILVDHARRRKAEKRGGGAEHVTLGDPAAELVLPPEELLALDAALTRLDEMDSRLRSVVEYRFFGGLTEQEIASVLGVTIRTVQRDWVKARAWLYQEIYPQAK
ncbi:MAG: sigma-70 family RNA polymerase sigma factor, partial [Gemmatimonadales bacterium]